MSEVVQNGVELEFSDAFLRHAKGCDCATCSSAVTQIVEDDSVIFVGGAQDASVDGNGGTIRGKPVFTIDEAAFYLNRGDGLITLGGVTYESGAEWFGGQGPARNDYYDLAVSKSDSDGVLNTITYGFYTTLLTLPEPYIFRNTAGNLQFGLGVARGFSPLSAAQQTAARNAIQTWDDLIAVSFVETPFAQGDINFMNTTTGPAQASAYLPYDYGVSTTKNFQGNGVSFAEISGDIYINPNQASNLQFGLGQYGRTTLVHELGHSLGMEHPGNYNFGPGFAVNYENGAEYYQDSNQYSIMSYWDAEETGAARVDWEFLNYAYPSTPMVHDVAAIQRVYGADPTTRLGDTTYGFNSNAGRDHFDFSLTKTPVVTIYDAGGSNDTLDVSGYSTDSIIDLNPGAYSSVGGFFSEDYPTLAEINARRVADGRPVRSQATYDLYADLFGDSFTNGLMRDNVGIAYGTWIENAVGGAGNDVIIGNAANNKLSGGAGNDRLMGGDGVDTLTGGAGNDVFVAEIGAATVPTKSGPLSLDIITDFKAGDKIDLSGIDANTTLDGEQSFRLVKNSSGNRAGDLFVKTFGNLNAAENSLGLDIDGDGVLGGGAAAGKVTVVFGNTDGGAPEFAIVLYGVDNLTNNDFIFA